LWDGLGPGAETASDGFASCADAGAEASRANLFPPGAPAKAAVAAEPKSDGLAAARRDTPDQGAIQSRHLAMRRLNIPFQRAAHLLRFARLMAPQFVARMER